MKAIMLVVCFAAATVVTAQDSTQTKPRFPAAVLAVKWSPLHLINHYATIQVAVEYRFKPFTSLQLDMGPIVQRGGLYDVSYLRARGFKLKAEVRHYLTRGDKPWRYYIAGELFMNRVNYQKDGTFGVDCINGDCRYYQSVRYKMEYREPGIHVKFGGMMTRGRFCLDYYVGLIGRIIRYRAIGKPDDDRDDFSEDTPAFTFDWPIEENRNVLMPTTCIRLGYVIK